MAATPDLTLEEAAEFLGLSPTEFKQKLKLDPRFKLLDASKKRDGTSFRYPRSILQDLARELGAGSSDENPIPRLEPVAFGTEDFKVPVTELGTADFQVSSAGSDKSEAASEKADEPLNLGSGDTQDIFTLAPDELGKDPSQRDPDSDVRLEAAPSDRPAGSDEPSPSPKAEEITLDLDLANPGSAVIKSGSSSKLSAPKSSSKITSDPAKSLPQAGAADSSDSSEFELSLDADSDDFELKLNTETSDEVELGQLPRDGEGGSSRRASESGILSRKPADSGISLEKGTATNTGKTSKIQSDDDSDVDFELSLDSAAAVSGTKLGGPKTNKPSVSDSDSEFELTLDDSSTDSSLESLALDPEIAEQKSESRDIFETDFEIPAMEEGGSSATGSASSDVSADSDFEVVIDESEAASGDADVAVVQEDVGDVDLAEIEEAEADESVAGALRGVKATRGDEEEEEDEPVASAAAYAPWGPLPALVLLPTLLFVLLGGLMSYELLQTMWGYQQPQKPTAPLLRSIASSLDMELRDQ